MSVLTNRLAHNSATANLDGDVAFGHLAHVESNRRDHVLAMVLCAGGVGVRCEGKKTGTKEREKTNRAARDNVHKGRLARRL
jgi:hypothetical protein